MRSGEEAVPRHPMMRTGLTPIGDSWYRGESGGRDCSGRHSSGASRSCLDAVSRCDYAHPRNETDEIGFVACGGCLWPRAGGSSGVW
jgi:hypothetical protein